MMKTGIRVADVPAKTFVLAHGLMTSSRTYVPLEHWPIFTLNHAIDLLSTIGNGLDWSKEGLLVDREGEEWLSSDMQAMVLAVQNHDFDAITRVKCQWHNSVMRRSERETYAKSAKCRMNLLDSDLEVERKFSDKPDMIQRFKERSRMECEAPLRPALSGPGKPWVPQHPYIYSLCTDSKCVTFPKNLRQDWLDLCVEVLEAILSVSNYTSTSDAEHENNLKEAKKALRKLDKIYPGRKSVNNQVPSSAVVTEANLGLHILSRAEYSAKFPEGSEYLGEGEDDLESGMIYWPLDAFSWGGPWEGNYVAYSLNDAREDEFEIELTSTEAVIQGEIERQNTWRYYCPSSAFERVFPEGIADTAMTPEQVKLFRESLEPELLKLYEESIAEAVDNFIRVELNGVPTLEKPFKLYLYGTDDCSYTKVFATKDDAIEFLYQLRDTSSWELVNTQMAFTN